MVLATFAVAVLPVLLVSAAQALGALRSTPATLGIAAVLSVAFSVAGSALWSRRPESRDLVFADLMLWGWIRRQRTERRLADARRLLGHRAGLSSSRQVQLLEQLSSALEARDPYTHGHSRRVTRYSEAIARGLGLGREDVARIRTAAAVHDVGKISTPREVLNKAGRLSDEEFAVIKRHPADGAAIVEQIGDPHLTAMVRHHHERLDGRGYPDGLAGAEMPLGARIIAVADTFDAITSTRPYRAGARHKKALDTLRREAGAQLDPDAVAAFLRYYSGRRSVAWWSVLVTEPPRLAYWLLVWVQGAGATPLAKGAATAGVTALIGASVAGPAAGDAGSRPERAAAIAQRADRAGDRAQPHAVAAEPDGAGAPALRQAGGGRPQPRGGGVPAGSEAGFSGAGRRRSDGDAARSGGSGSGSGGDERGAAGSGGATGSAGGGGHGGGAGSGGGGAVGGGSGSGGGGSGDGRTGPDGADAPRDEQPVDIDVPDAPAVEKDPKRRNVDVDVTKVPPVKVDVPEPPPVRVDVPEVPPVEVEVPEVPPVEVEVPDVPPVEVKLPTPPKRGAAEDASAGSRAR
jgi:putative nucleotidyltransferase with HDIG domain